MFRFVTLPLLAICSSVAFAQANSDCGEQVDHAVNSCRSRINAARNSDVSSFGDSSGVPGGNASQAGAAYALRERIGQQIANCDANDRQVCVDQCNAALRSASARNDSASVQRIKKNMSRCNDQIDASIADGQRSQQGLTRFASENNNQANEVCEEGQACGTPDPNIVKANTPCGPGEFWSVRWNQCAGIRSFTPRDMIPTPFGK